MGSTSFPVASSRYSECGTIDGAAASVRRLASAALLTLWYSRRTRYRLVRTQARKAGFEVWEDSFSVGDKGSRMDIFLSPSLPAGSVCPRPLAI